MKFIYQTSFRLRIWLAFVMIICIAIASVGIISYYIAARVAEKNAFQLNQEAVMKTSQALEEKLYHVRISVLSMMVNTNYRKAIGLEISSGNDNYYTLLSKMQDTLTQLKLIEPMIDSILVATPDGDYHLTVQKRQLASFYHSQMYERVLEDERRHKEAWIEQHIDPFFQSKQEVISFVTLGSLSDVSANAFVVANVRTDQFKEFVSSTMNQGRGRYILLSDSGEQFIQMDPDFDINLPQYEDFRQALQHTEGQFEFEAGNQTYIVNYKRTLNMNGMMLFSVLSKSELLKELNNIKWLITFTITGFLLFSLIFADLVTRWMLKPLNYLRKLMKNAGRNDFNVLYESKYQDEISQLGYQFNSMLNEIQQLFQEMRQVEAAKHKAEVQVLQAQINPHFLYNTLNTIYWKSQMKQLKDVQEMVLALSKLFQLGLNRGQELTPLRNELQHVEQYLTIQQLCYTRLFTYEIEVAGGVDYERQVLKVMLQPLVENSILHGFKDRNEGGQIRIQIYEAEQYLYLVVEDNGKGFDEQSNQEERLLANSSEVQGGYALSNVRQRIQLHYGDSGRLELASKRDCYTRVTIRIPSMEQPTTG
ncbi:sensor histidine kinase [Paenibacillaceae bacterium]|nr:sensor histidine kinase [Paenibacillaceae bacterium]